MNQFCNLDKDTAERIHNLHLEFTPFPQPELLVAMLNASPDVEYQVSIGTDEFTSLCPLNLGQPDYATIWIVYSPALKTVELKSIKMYLASFRQVAIFHELVPVTIMKALRDLISPLDLTVTGIFKTRGGLDTNVSCEYHAPNRGLEE